MATSYLSNIGRLIYQVIYNRDR
eukprot:UN16192